MFGVTRKRCRTPDAKRLLRVLNVSNFGMIPDN
jgi:hypothetical protein